MPHFMLFDLYHGGHHGQYIRQLVDYWGANNLPGRLDVVVSTRFLEVHSDVQQAAETAAGVHLVPIEDALDLQPVDFRSLVRCDLVHGRLLRYYVTTLRPDHVVIMYFDHMQLSLAFDLRFRFPIQFSGVYFRPSFHYDRLSATSVKERLQRLRKRAVLSAALRNPHFARLLCLDPYVVPYTEALSRRVQAVALPDGVAPHPALRSRSEVHARWGVEAGRRVAVFFGSIDARKGIHQLVEALFHLAPEQQRRLCLVVAGSIRDAERGRVYEGLRRVRGETAIQVVVEDRFVDEAEIPGIMEAADLVLLPYQRHLGSSGVLVRAALAGVPVLGSDYGLVGEHMRRHRLGLAVDATAPRAIGAGLSQWLVHPDVLPFDEEEARRFARANTAECFAATVFQHLAAPGHAAALENRS